MELKNIDTLIPAPYNPRILDKHDGASLEASIKRWGDISGVTKNVRTGFTITGNQRTAILIKAFGSERVKIQIEHNFDTPDEFGTVAIGHVIVTGTNIMLNYREVNVSEGEEKTMNVAANRIEARWDLDLLAQVNYEISQLDDGAALLALSGQSEHELSKLNKMIGVEPEGNTPPADDKESIFRCPTCNHEGNKTEFATGM